MEVQAAGQKRPLRYSSELWTAANDNDNETKRMFLVVFETIYNSGNNPMVYDLLYVQTQTFFNEWYIIYWREFGFVLLPRLPLFHRQFLVVFLRCEHFLIVQSDHNALLRSKKQYVVSLWDRLSFQFKVSTVVMMLRGILSSNEVVSVLDDVKKISSISVGVLSFSYYGNKITPCTVGESFMQILVVSARLMSLPDTTNILHGDFSTYRSGRRDKNLHEGFPKCPDWNPISIIAQGEHIKQQLWWYSWHHPAQTLLHERTISPWGS